MKPITFLVAITTVAVVLSTARATSSPGTWQPIKNPNDFRIRMVAEYAVFMHNFKTEFKHPLRLVDVDSGSIHQFKNGVIYTLIVSAAQADNLSSKGSLYQTAVRVSLDRTAGGLIYFMPVM
ncbi:unnamed protein product [Linum trigynum]|uniref:Cystatin domain-containing protein n=1 Tax=Linum trigynum TaxID=586398 RepID=A0AAV2EMD9_9ROSI